MPETLPAPPFSAKEWQSRAWMARFDAWVRRYLKRQPEAWQLQLTQKFFELSPGPQLLPSTFRAYRLPERSEGLHPDAADAQRYIERRYGQNPVIHRYFGDDGYYGYV